MPSLLGRKPSFHFQWRHLTIRTTRHDLDALMCFELRHTVFHEEMLNDTQYGLDIDKYDATHCQMMFIDTASDELIGTCRVSSTEDTEWYTATEFDCSALESLPGQKSEVGRVCIRKDHRNTMTLLAVARCLARYAQEYNVRWLFGCTSVSTCSPLASARLSNWLANQGLLLDEPYRAKNPLVLTAPDWACLDACEEKNLGVDVPPLMRLYMKAGAHFGGQPAYDPEFRCVDFFTLLDREHASPSFTGRYLG